MPLAWPWQRAAVTRKFLASLPGEARSAEDDRGSVDPTSSPASETPSCSRLSDSRARLEGLKNRRPERLSPRLPPLAGWLPRLPRTRPASSPSSDLEAWGASSERCLELALENLAARSKDRLVEVAEGFYHSPWQDCYDPARILLRDILGPLDIKGDPVAFAPNWNHLLVTGSEDLEGLAGGLIFAMKVLAEETRPMTALPLVRRGGEWVDLDLPKGHVVEPLLRKARVLELSSVYRRPGSPHREAPREGRH